jgi:hypothetical protein
MDDRPFQISFSKFRTFRQCRRKYWLDYVEFEGRHDEKPLEPVTAPGVVGHAVHEALRRACVTGNDELGERAVRLYLGMPSHRVAGPGTHWFELAMELYRAGMSYAAAIPSRPGDRHLELGGKATLPSHGIVVQARVDRVDYLGDDQWLLIDWKTSRFSDPSDDEQLEIAHVVVRTKLQERMTAAARVMGRVVNLRHLTLPVHERPEMREKTMVFDDARASARDLLRQSEFLRGLPQSEFYPMPGPQCGSCRWARPEFCRLADRTSVDDWLEDDDDDDPAAWDGDNDDD